MKIEEYLSYDPENGSLYWTQKASKKTIIGGVAGSVKPTGYICVTFNKKKLFAHRIVWYLHHGYWPSEIDHIDRNPGNNKIENLREVSSRQNQQNTQRFNFGCYLTQDTNKWRARLFVEGKKISLGCFNSKEEAQKAYKQKVLELND